MRQKARFVWGALFFLAGLAAFSSLAWMRFYHTKTFAVAEPFFRCPVPVFTDRVLLRNDRFGKGRFGVSRSGGRSHKGIDLLVAVGNPVFASKSGRVSHAGVGKGYGWYLELLHPDGRKTRYAHLSRMLVSKGAWVAAGEKIGLAGKSGNARDPRIRPHLHFEIRDALDALDPAAGLLDPALVIA